MGLRVLNTRSNKKRDSKGITLELTGNLSAAHGSYVAGQVTLFCVTLIYVRPYLNSDVKLGFVNTITDCKYLDNIHLTAVPNMVWEEIDNIPLYN